MLSRTFWLLALDASEVSIAINSHPQVTWGPRKLTGVREVGFVPAGSVGDVFGGVTHLGICVSMAFASVWRWGYNGELKL